MQQLFLGHWAFLFRHSLLFLLATIFLWPANTIRGAEPGRRNVVLLVADDLGCDLGCYGNSKIKTPNLDALAANGVRFSHAFAAVSSCSPSRSVLYTGLHTHANGQYGLAHRENNFHTLPAVKSLPKLLKDAGYRTAILGKNHVLPPEVYPFEELSLPQGGTRNVVGLADKARQFFSAAGTKPFLLVVGFNDTHRTGKNLGFGNDRTFKDVPAVKYDPKNVIVPYFLPDRPEVREELADYYQSASRLDHGVGLIVKALKEVGQADNTLVIFVSDNGIPFPGAKTTLYDPGVRLPLVISSPIQKKRGLVNSAMASWTDVTPTILDWAGVKTPNPLHGRSLLPILEEEQPKGWDVIHGSHQFHTVVEYYPMRMIRTREHKLILNLAHKLDYPFASDLYGSRTWQGILKRGDKMLGQRSIDSYVHRPREELYELTKDPNELKNLAADPAYTKVLGDLRGRLKTWRKETGDPWLGKYDRD